jgi:steroid delta-isomerase-like uncharacterized protein
MQAPPPPVDWQSLEVRSRSDAGTPKATEKERAVAEHYLNALASPTFEPLGSLLADDVHFAFGEKDSRGRERVVAAHASLFGAFENRQLFARRILRTDQSQSIEWTMTGTHAGSWAGLSATGKPVTFQGITLLWTNDDGSISDIHVYFDVAVVKAQLGSGPAQLQRLGLPSVPAGPPEIIEQGGTPLEASHVAVVRGTLDALENNNPSAFLSSFADDIDVFTLDHQRPVHGRDPLERMFNTLHKSIGDLDTVVQNTWGVQQHVLVEYAIAGLQLAPIGRTPFVPNRLLSTRLVDIVEVRDGKIARFWRYDDSGALEPK